MPSLDSKYAMKASSLSSFGGGFSLTGFFFIFLRAEPFADGLDALIDGGASVPLGIGTGGMACTTDRADRLLDFLGTTTVVDPCDFSFLG